MGAHVRATLALAAALLAAAVVVGVRRAQPTQPEVTLREHLEADSARAAQSEGGPGACAPLLVDPRRPSRWVAMPGGGRLDVRVAGAAGPMAGKMETAPDGSARFVPAFPFTPGLRYEVASGACSKSFTAAADPPRRPEVRAIYPRVKALPENTLRFYVYFNEPMADGDFLDHIRLEHLPSGDNLTGVFFDNVHELWSRDRKRITLLVDPGRVKSGLRAHQRLGRAFSAGQRYRLTIAPGWKSLRGAAVTDPFSVTYTAAAEDRQRVDVDSWTVALTGQDIDIDFGEPVDHVSVQHMLSLLSPDGRPVKGRWRLQPGDRQVRFTPSEPWQGPVSAHMLRAHGRFEDIAGNNLGAAFDHPVGDVAPGGESQPVSRTLSELGAHPSL